MSQHIFEPVLGLSAPAVDRYSKPPRPTESARVSPSQLRPAERAGASILIAEDHSDSRDALQALLEAMGYRVTTATNGADAVERAAAAEPDLILMDVMMPLVDGLEATRRLRADARFTRVPILALTAMEGAREQVFEAGCDDLISKPIDITTLFQKVQSWLGKGRV